MVGGVVAATMRTNQQLKCVSLGFYCGHSFLSLQAKACHLKVQYKRGLFAHSDRESSIFKQEVIQLLLPELQTIMYHV